MTANGGGVSMISSTGAIYCDCCGTEKVAEIVGDNLVIKARRHGVKHVAVVPLRELLDRQGKARHNTVIEAGLKIE